jgi:hypothetical protein
MYRRAANALLLLLRRGASSLPIVDTPWSFYDNFSSYANQTFLVPGGGTPALDWSAYSNAGAATGEKYNPVVASATQDIRVRASGSISDFASNGVYMIGRDIGAVDHFVTCTWAVSASSRRMSVGAVDNLNRLEVDAAGSNTVTRVIGGTRTSLSGTPGSLTTNRNGGVRQMVVGDRMDYAVWNANLYLYKNGLSMRAALSLSTLTGTRFGFPTNSGGFDGADNVGATPLTKRITIDALKRPYPRIQGLGGYADGARDIAVTGTWECKTDTPPTGLHWRLIDFEFGDKAGYVYKEWDWVSSPIFGAGSLSGGVYTGTWSATIRVPCGLAGKRPYMLAVRTSDDTFAYAVQGPFAVTYTIGAFGQSNMANYAGTNNVAGVPDHPGGTYYKPSDPPSMADAINRVASSWYDSQTEGLASDINSGMVSKLLSDALDLPVHVINLAIPATGAVNVGPSGTNATYLQTHLAFGGGAFDAIMMSQGENEFFSTSEASAWKGTWRDTNIPGFRAWSGQPDGTVIPVFVSITGRYDAVPADPTQANTASTTLRRSQVELVSEVSNTYLANHHVGCVMVDSYHYGATTETGMKEVCRRMGLTLAQQLGSGSYDGRGPYATGVTRSAANLTIAINLNGASSIAGTALTSWEVSTSADFSTGNQTINSCAVSGSDVAIVLAGDPAAPVYVRNHTGYNPDISAWVIGTYADASTIYMEPVLVPLLSN